jgi:hypothetical protein
MKAPWLLLCLVALGLVIGAAIVLPAGADGGWLYVSVDLKDAPFEEALRQLFSGPVLGFADYVVESGPAEGTTATIRLEERTRADEALTRVLGQYGLSCRWVGRTIYIFRTGTLPDTEEGLLLYLRANGDRIQLRLRAYPYARGGEKLLWESPKDIFQSAYIVPSPSFRYVAIAWRGESYDDDTPDDGPQLLLLPTAGGAAKRIPVPEGVESVVWMGDDELDIAGDGNGRWRYQPAADRLTRAAEKGEELLRVAYAGQVRALDGLLTRAKLPFAFPTRDLEWVIRAAVSDQLNRGMNIWAPPQAAISPDGRYAALVGAEAAVSILDVATGALLRRIPATRLVATEGVALGQLHWSPDSARLVFTESHLHAARYHALAGPTRQMPSVTDWTDLVREYLPATGETRTLAVGFDAYRVPAEAAKGILASSDPHSWEAADDQQRWGRYAGEGASGH